jgi:hypothetical protein
LWGATGFGRYWQTKKTHPHKRNSSVIVTCPFTLGPARATFAPWCSKSPTGNFHKSMRLQDLCREHFCAKIITRSKSAKVAPLRGRLLVFSRASRCARVRLLNMRVPKVGGVKSRKLVAGLRFIVLIRVIQKSKVSKVFWFVRWLSEANARRISDRPYGRLLAHALVIARIGMYIHMYTNMELVAIVREIFCNSSHLGVTDQPTGQDRHRR